MKPLHAMMGLTVAGVCLVLLSFAWRGIVGQRGGWSDEQAKEHARLSAEGHWRMHAQAEGPSKTRETHKTHADHASQTEGMSLDEIKQKYWESRAELERAQNRGKTTALVLRWLGAVCTVVGGAGYFVLRNKD